SLLLWFSSLPLRLLHCIRKALTMAVCTLPGRYRQRLQANAGQAGYEDPAFARRAAAQTGATLMEIPKVWLKTNNALALCHNPQVDIVREALAEKRGVLYLTPHLGCFEINARILVQHGPIT